MKVLMSPPAWGAWIEMAWRRRNPHILPVAPPHRGRGLKYRHGHRLAFGAHCRPPHGGRGLKSMRNQNQACALSRPPPGGRGLKYPAPPAGTGRSHVAPRMGGED